MSAVCQPSGNANLRWYGEGFAQDLGERFPNEGHVSELAQLDWALRLAFDGADAPVLVLADLAALPIEAWSHVGFVLHPSCARLRLRHNTLAIWQALESDQVPPDASALAEPGELLIWRRGHKPHFRSLQALETAALDALRAGSSFAEMCARLSESFDGQNMAVDTGTLLRRWVDEELLSVVRTNTE